MRLLAQVRLELRYHARASAGAAPALDERALDVVRAFGAALPRIRELLDTDVLAAYRGDPAARSVDEVLLCYPGRARDDPPPLAHQLYALGVPLLARIVAELAHARHRHRHPPGRAHRRAASSSTTAPAS